MLAFLVSCSTGPTVPKSKTTVTPTPKTSGIYVLSLGRRQNTNKGNVIVYTYDRSVPATKDRQPSVEGDIFIAFDIEGCAGPNADQNTGITAGLFYLQIDPKHPPYAPVDPVRQPALHDTALAPGRCARGWVTFEVPKDLKPAYILFRGPPRTAWHLPG